MKTFVYCTFTKEAVHHFPGAEGDSAISYLACPHRHLFHYEVRVEVLGDNREIEFIKFRTQCTELAPSGDLQDASCERIAGNLACGVSELYPGREIVVRVSEDGENGAHVCLGPYG